MEKLAYFVLLRGDVNGDKIFDEKDLSQIAKQDLGIDLRCDNICPSEIQDDNAPVDIPSSCADPQINPEQSPKIPHNPSESTILSIAPIWQYYFKNCSYIVDLCYQSGGTEKNRQFCNNALFGCLQITSEGTYDCVYEVLRFLRPAFVKNFDSFVQMSTPFNYHCQNNACWFIPGRGGIFAERFFDWATVTKECGQSKDNFYGCEVTILGGQLPADMKNYVKRHPSGIAYINANGDLVMNYSCIDLEK